MICPKQFLTSFPTFLQRFQQVSVETRFFKIISFSSFFAPFVPKTGSNKFSNISRMFSTSFSRNEVFRNNLVFKVFSHYFSQKQFLTSFPTFLRRFQQISVETRFFKIISFSRFFRSICPQRTWA